MESTSTGKWYYGCTSNLIRRLEAHNAGLNASTNKRGPWRYIFTRTFVTQTEARKFEIALKRARNKNFIRKAYAEYFLT